MRTAFMALVFTLLSAVAASAQICPACAPCSLFKNEIVQEACVVKERIVDPLGISKLVTKQSMCAVERQVVNPVCQQCSNAKAQCETLAAKLPGVRDVCRASVSALDATRKATNDVRRNAWSEFNSAVRRSGLNTEQEAVLYDLPGTATFTYNAYTGTYWYEVILPKGIKFEKGKVKSSMEGSFSAPQLDFKTVTNELGFLKANSVNKYEDWAANKRAQPGRNYVASKRFVDTMSLENAAQEIAWAVVTAGQTAKGSLEALKELLILEWGDILSWLREVGIDKSEDVATEIAKAILENGKKAAIIPIPLGKDSRFDIKVSVDVIKYEYDLVPSVPDEMKKLISMIGIKSDKALAGKGVKAFPPHLAFSISFGSPQNSSTKPQTFADFANLLEKGPGIDFRNHVSGAISSAFNIDLKEAGKFQDMDQEIRASFAKAMSGALGEAEKYHKGNGVFDFTKSQFGDKLQAKINQMAAGNKGKAKLSKLAVDLKTATITFEAELLNKHVLFTTDLRKEMNAAWQAKEKAESKVYDETMQRAKSACDGLANLCKDMAKVNALSQGCGVPPGYEALALDPLTDPTAAETTSSQPAAPPNTHQKGGGATAAAGASAAYSVTVTNNCRHTPKVETYVRIFDNRTQKWDIAYELIRFGETRVVTDGGGYVISSSVPTFYIYSEGIYQNADGLNKLGNGYPKVWMGAPNSNHFTIWKDWSPPFVKRTAEQREHIIECSG